MADAKSDPAILDAIDRLVRDTLAADGPLLTLGLCGAQGSGKTTVAATLAERWRREGLATSILSLDDLYKTRADRSALARLTHPLFATRGPPGTHDVTLGLETITALKAGRAIALPRFDKGLDDRRPRESWDRAVPDTRILILEGWCVGARPQAESDLRDPINTLEREEDADGIWRHHVNAALASDYQTLFRHIDRLVLLAAPGFGIVKHWRTQQEDALRQAGSGGMPDAAIARFVQHYERLTRHILATMPAYADIVFPLDDARRVSPSTGGERP